ncbi:tail subunit [Vibrio phage vB_VpS_BA3]|nr:tail subunit [Vibrio phage vB_VpS_BA3]
MADGSRHTLYMVEEGTTKDKHGVTPNTPAMATVRNTGVTLGLAKDSLQSEEIRGDRQIADFRLGANQVGGDINFEMSHLTFDGLILGALQAADWVDTNPVNAKQKQAKAGTTRRSFTMMRHFADIADKPYFLFKGVEINSMNISFSANAMVTGTFSVLGKSQLLGATAPTGATYPAVTTSRAMDAFTGAIQEGGENIAVVTEASLTIENGLNPRFVVGSKDGIYPENGRSNVTGSITAYFENAALVEKFINETPSSLMLEAADTAGNKYQFLMPRIVYTGGQPDVAGEGSIVLTMPFQAILDPTEQTNIKVTRINA